MVGWGRGWLYSYIKNTQYLRKSSRHYNYYGGCSFFSSSSCSLDGYNFAGIHLDAQKDRVTLDEGTTVEQLV